ncbi:ABC transporter substrate-binding protein [Tissierella sp. MB52-C2]|uniref:ABC transporter substrate-binding protein n=1 Tax=Tissierella sp. MB52-C2 TaxID=3070999 RepID=UPI00280B9802|nr:ABC transporter substrate-binding protein [Tissierella sp. MB52-C2]WMM25895.1 ABC transporter substrate-binding protein [Tissierella sp. MB52-C2]
MKKQLLALFLVLVLSISLVGCKSKPVDNNEIVDEVGEVKEDEILTEITESTEVVFWHAMSGSNEEALVNLADKFMDENPNIKINLQFQGNYRELFEKLMAAAKANQLPTMTQIYSNRLSWYVEKGLVENLNPYMENEKVGLSKEELADYPALFLDDGIWNGNQYAMPFNKSQMVLYYNVDMFEEAGVEVPKTWEEWKVAAEKLTKDTDGDGEPDIYGLVFANNISTDIAPWLKQAGGMTMSEETNELYFDTPETEEAIEFLNGLIQSKVARTAGEDKYANVPVSQGRAAMCVASTSAISTIEKSTLEGINIFAAPLPGHKTNDQLYYGTNVAVYNTGTPEEKLGAWLFSKFLSTPENTAYLAQETGYLPARYSAREIPEYKAYLESAPIKAVGLESFDIGFQGTRNIGGINALDVLGEELDLVFAGEKSVPDALKDAQERGTRALEEARKN